MAKVQGLVEEPDLVGVFGGEVCRFMEHYRGSYGFTGQFVDAVGHTSPTSRDLFGGYDQEVKMVYSPIGFF